jgi:hypothetical protein
MIKKYSTKEAAKKLGLCPQRILAKIKQGHFPSAHTCECGRSILITETDLLNQPQKRKYTYDEEAHKARVARATFNRFTKRKSTSR